MAKPGVNIRVTPNAGSGQRVLKGASGGGPKANTSAIKNAGGRQGGGSRGQQKQ